MKIFDIMRNKDKNSNYQIYIFSSEMYIANNKIIK